jgi:hypothetical protein
MGSYKMVIEKVLIVIGGKAKLNGSSQYTEL